eukprot:scaffold38719_cov62-Phaeocystis_antarctica.AAC.1
MPRARLRHNSATTTSGSSAPGTPSRCSSARNTAESPWVCFIAAASRKASTSRTAATRSSEVAFGGRASGRTSYRPSKSTCTACRAQE